MQSLLLLIAPAPGYMRRDALHEEHQLRPFHRTEADAMKQFHHLAAFAYKYIYVTICRIQTYAAYFAA